MFASLQLNKFAKVRLFGFIYKQGITFHKQD